MKMTSQHGKMWQITPIMPKIQLYTQKCIRQMFKCSMYVSNRKVRYRGDLDQRYMSKNIPILAPKPLQIYTCHASFETWRFPAQNIITNCSHC